MVYRQREGFAARGHDTAGVTCIGYVKSLVLDQQDISCATLGLGGVIRIIEIQGFSYKQVKSQKFAKYKEMNE